jgi:hypothetical protein
MLLPTGLSWSELSRPEVGPEFTGSLMAMYSFAGVAVTLLRYDPESVPSSDAWDRALELLEQQASEAFIPGTQLYPIGSPEEEPPPGITSFITFTGLDPFWNQPVGSGLYDVAPGLLVIVIVTGRSELGFGELPPIDRMAAIAGIVSSRLEEFS